MLVAVQTPRHAARRRRASARAFSLVELMNLIALVALLVTIGMYGFSVYIKHAKTAEAVGNVTAIGQSAAAYFNDSDAHQPAGTRPEQAKAMRHFPPSSRQTVPAELESIKGKKFQSAIGDWSVSPWMELQFKVTQPQCYAYGFDAQGSGQAAQATVTATGDLDGNGVRSTYRLSVVPDPQLQAVVGSTIDRENPEE
jgi:type II secretory pathway pseudopilin PulG